MKRIHLNFEAVTHVFNVFVNTLKYFSFVYIILNRDFLHHYFLILK